MISDLIRAEDDGDRLTLGELLMLAATLLGAGTDTTRNQLAAAVQVLCEHPDQWALLGKHPELACNAVHELMRYCPIIFGTIRKAAQDVQLAGVTIPAVTLVLANTASANRDPAVYDDPDRLDITREVFDYGDHNRADPDTPSAVAGAAGPVQHLPPGIEPGFDRVTPTQKQVVDYS